MNNRNPADRGQELICFSSTEIVEEIDDVFGSFGFKDSRGNMVIEPQYASVGEFAWGLCPVCLARTWYTTPEGSRMYETHWGYIDTRGKTVIPMRFRQAWSFNRYGVAVVEEEYTSARYLIDTQGQKIDGSEFAFLSHYYSYYDRYLEFTDDLQGMYDDRCVMGVYDTKERRVIYQPAAEAAYPQDDNCIIVEEQGDKCSFDRRMRYIDSTGSDLYPWLSDKCFGAFERPDSAGFSIVTVCSYTRLPPEEIPSHYDDERLKYRCDRLRGVADGSGELVIPAEYDDIKRNGDGGFVCRKGEREKIVYL